MRQRLLAFLLFSVLPGLSAAAAMPPISASVGFAAQVVNDRGYDLVDENDHLPMFRVAAGYGLELKPGALDLELTYLAGNTQAPVHLARQAQLSLQTLEAGATYRYRLHRFLEPYGRLGVGYSWALLSIGSVERLRQMSGAVEGTALLGLQIPVRLGGKSERGIQLVFDLGAGYTARPSMGFHELLPAAPKKASPEDVPVASVDLGELSLSGITYRLGAALRF